MASSDALASIRVQLERVKEGQAAVRAGLRTLRNVHSTEHTGVHLDLKAEHADARLLFRDLRVLVSGTSLEMDRRHFRSNSPF